MLKSGSEKCVSGRKMWEILDIVLDKEFEVGEVEKMADFVGAGASFEYVRLV